MSFTFNIEVSNTEKKAFDLLVPDADEWVQHAVRNKIRKAAIRIVDMHLEDIHRYLTPADLVAIKAVMDANNDSFKQPKDWSLLTIKEIIDRTTMPTRAERDAVEFPMP